MRPNLKIVAFSDTHAHHREVTISDGDVLIFGGDFMTCGYKFAEVMSFAAWFKNQPHKHKIMIAGNHDRLMQSSLRMCLNEFGNNVTYLQDSSCEIDGWKFWGSPYQPWFCDWAFNVQRGPEIKKHWDRIPTNTDVLITHGPPYGVLDQTIGWGGNHVGCEDLRKVVDKISPKIHIFGHIHAGHGTTRAIDYIDNYDLNVTHFYNVSICDEAYEPLNAPMVIDLKEQ